MTRTDLAANQYELVAPDGLHARTFPLDARAARQLAASAIATCASGSGSGIERRDLGIPQTNHPGHCVYLSSPRRLVVGLGIAARLVVPGGPARDAATRAISRFIASVPCDDTIGRPGSVTTAFGALPFDPRADGEVIIPEMTLVCETEGRSWMTVAGTGLLATPELAGVYSRSRASRVPSPFEEPGTADAPRIFEGDASVFTDAVSTALREIRRGNLAKVVLARKVSASFSEPIDIVRTLRSLEKREPTSTVFAVVSPGETFMGASPELLIAKEGPQVRSVPLAGTVRRTGDPVSDDLAVARMVESSKENLEHRVVVDAVIATLAELCGHLEIAGDPEVISLRQVAHLATRLSASLVGEERPWPSALDIAATLHPTPAVGGSPTGSALDLIREVEPTGRGFYAGPVGWVDANGDGEFFIGIRSAQIHGASAAVYAGAGIVAGSDPFEELAETTVKLDTMLGAFASD